MAEPSQPTRPKASWKDGGKVSPAAARQQSEAARRGKIFRVLFALLALVGVVIALFLQFRPPREPYLVPFFITEYQDRHLPANLQTEPDRAALLAGNYFPNKETNTFSSQERHLLLRELESLRGRKPADAVVLYLSAHVLSDPRGELFVLPGNATVDDPAGWVDLAQVLKDLRDCPAGRKLLVLDVMQALADPRLGVLANDVAGRVEAALAKVEDPQRLVLCACAPGQVSLTSEEMGQTVFGFYLDEGLRGWADGYNAEGRTNGRVSVQELASYVRARVDRWATRNRAARQTPVLHGTADFDLVLLEHGRPRAPQEPEETGALPAWLLEGWQLRDRWWDDETYRLSPFVFRRLEAAVLRAEKHWRGGVEPGKVQSDFQKVLAELKDEAGRARLQLPEPRTAALAIARGVKPAPALLEELKTVLVKRESLLANLKPDEAKPAEDKLRDEYLAKVKDRPAVELVGAVFEAAADDATPRPERLKFLYGLLSKQLPPTFVEVLFLHRLNDLAGRLQKQGKTWPLEAVRQALKAVRDGEQAAACEPLAFPWVRDLLEKAAQDRHDGEVLLFTPDFASPARAAALLKSAGDQYRSVNNALEVIHEAYRGRDRGHIQLASVAPYLMNRPDMDLRAENTWKLTVEALAELEAALRVPPDGFAFKSEGEFRARVEQVAQKAEALRGQLRLLLAPFSDDELRTRVQQSKRSNAGASAVVDLDALLEAGCLKAKERQELYAAARSLSARLHEETLEDERANAVKLRQQLEVQSFATEGAEQLERARAARRAQVALDLLKLGGVAEAEKLQQRLAQLTRTADKPTAWPEFAAEVRQAWAALPAQLGSLPDLRDRDRLSHSLHPCDVPSLMTEPSTNPNLLTWTRQAEAQYGWLADRCRYEVDDLGALGEPRNGFTLGYYYDTALSYDAAAPNAKKTGSVRLARPGEVPNFRDGERSASWTLSVTLSPPPAKETAVTVHAEAADEDWLAVPDDQARQEKGAFEVALSLRLRPGADMTSTPPPEGFLAAVRAYGRTFHHKVPVLLPTSKAKQVQILISQSPSDAGGALGELLLRPNARQPIYLSVHNPGEQRRKVALELKAEGHPNDGIRSPDVEVEPNGKKRVSFGKGAPADKPQELPELKGPQGQAQLELRLLDVENKNTVLDRKAVRVAVGSPREYVQVTQVPNFDPVGRKLTVKLKLLTPVLGAPCRVKLVLPQERIPGLLKAEGATEVDLPNTLEERTLTAENLVFASDRSEETGYVYLTVDGYERAFIYHIAFPGQGNTPTSGRPVFRTDLRLAGGELARATNTYRTVLEVDNPPPVAALEVQMDRANNDQFVTELRFPGDRNTRVGFTPTGPEGDLLFETAVRDWVAPLNVGGISGARRVRALLLDPAGKLLLTTRTKELVVDNTPPEDVRILQVGDRSIPSGGNGAPPPQVKRAALLAVRAEGSDRESGVRDVFLFWGKPVDGKPPAGGPQPVRAEPLNNEKTVWKSQLVLAPDKKGVVEITAQFVNNLNLSTFETVQVEVVEPPPPAAAATTGTIEGVVLEGGRAQPPGLPVYLYDKQNMLKDKTTTGPGSKFVFKDLPPETYTVVAEKKASMTRGQTTLTVQKGETSSAEIKLAR